MVPQIQSETHNLSFWASFCPFSPSQPRKSKFWKNEKKYLEMSSFYTSVPKITIIWCMLPEIWSAADINFVILNHFLPFTPLLTLKIEIWKNCKKKAWRYPFTNVYHKRRSYDVWFLWYDRGWWTEFIVILDHFFPF